MALSKTLQVDKKSQKKKKNIQTTTKKLTGKQGFVFSYSCFIKINKQFARGGTTETWCAVALLLVTGFCEE